jgi:hypothetical protein
MYRSKLPTLFILVAMLLSSCGAQSPLSATPKIDVSITNTEKSTVMVETIPQNNCNGNSEVENQVQRTRTVQHVVETQSQFSVNENGQIGFGGTDIELGTTVAAELGYTYGSEDAVTRSITVKAKPGTNMQHAVKQVEVWKTGEAQVTVGNQSVSVPFRFLQDFSVELEESKDMKCDGSTPTVSNYPPQSISGGCISSETWTLASTDTDTLSGISVDANGCYQTDVLGVFPDNSGTLHVNLRNQKKDIVTGIYTPVDNNSVVEFKVYVNSMYIVYAEKPVVINFAIAPVGDVMTAKNTARFKLQVEGKKEKPRVYYYMADVNEYNGVKLDTQHYEYGDVSTIRFELVGNTMKVFVNDIKMDEELLIPTAQKVFYLGYNIPTLAGADVEISGITIDGVAK